MDRPVRLGFVGAGTMGQLAHLANYANLAGVELAALAEGRTELARAVAARYGVASVYPNHRSMLDEARLDAVVAICPFILNYGLAHDILAAGLHLATEKPLCLRLSAADELVARSAGTGLVYQVSYMKRWDPGIELARQQVAAWRASGEVGELLLARVWCAAPADWTAQIEPPLRTDEPVPSYDAVPEPDQLGCDPDSLRWVSSFLNYYSHQTNLARWLLGEDFTPAYHDRWSGGNLVVAHAQSGARILFELHTFASDGWDEGVDLVFERGRVEARLPAPLARQRAAAVTITRVGGAQAGDTCPHVPPLWAMRQQAQGFVTAVRGGPQRSTAAEAAKEVELAWRLAATRGG